MQERVGRRPPGQTGGRPDWYRPGGTGPQDRQPAAPDFSEQARRRAEKRRKHRKHVMIAFYTFLFAAVIGAAAALSLTVFFRITSVDVAGTSRYSAEEIRSASGIQTGDNLFRIHAWQSAEKIRSKLPYLGTVKVSRKFPARVLITVQEEKVWGAVKYGSRYYILGESGRALESAASLPKDCTELRGLSVQSAKVGSTVGFKNSDQLSLYQEIMGAVQKNGLTRITAVDFSQTAKILLVYDGRVTINLGMPTDLDYKLAFAKNLLTNNIKSTEYGTLNLSVVSDTNRAYFDPDYGAASSQASKK